MAESSSSAPRALAHPFFELRLGIAAWVALMLGTCAYCLIHQTFVSAVTPDVTRTLTPRIARMGRMGLARSLALAYVPRHGSMAHDTVPLLLDQPVSGQPPDRR